MSSRRKLSTSVGGRGRQRPQDKDAVSADQNTPLAGQDDHQPAKKRRTGLRSATARDTDNASHALVSSPLGYPVTHSSDDPSSSASGLPAEPSTALLSDPNAGPSSSLSVPVDKIGVTSNVVVKAQATRKKKPSVVTRKHVKVGKGRGCLRSTQPTQEEKWDDHFNDPEAKLIIKSDDGVKFRASRWQLSQCSGFFAGMLTLPQPADIDTHIELLAPAKVIRLVLSMIALPPTLRSWPHGRCSYPNVRDCLEALDFAAKYEVAGVREAALHALGGAVYGAAVELFKGASDRDDPDVAAIAIRFLKKEDFAKGKVAQFKGCQRFWLKRLASIFAMPLYNRGTYKRGDGTDVEWYDTDAIAAHFARDVRGRSSGEPVVPGVLSG